jgi:hypothetical protein
MMDRGTGDFVGTDVVDISEDSAQVCWSIESKKRRRKCALREPRGKVEDDGEEMSGR